MPVEAHFVLTEWTAREPGADLFEGERREVMRFEAPDPQHGVQDIGFDPAVKPEMPGYGMLYVLVGEGTSVWRGNARAVGRPEPLRRQGRGRWLSRSVGLRISQPSQAVVRPRARGLDVCLRRR